MPSLKIEIKNLNWEQYDDALSLLEKFAPNKTKINQSLLPPEFLRNCFACNEAKQFDCPFAFGDEQCKKTAKAII